MSDIAPEGLPDGKQDAATDAAVRARLSKEVAAWSAERSGRVQSDAADLVTTSTKPPVRTAKPASKRSPKPARSVPTSASSKPFAMSYDGVTSREYMDQVIARGSR